MSASETPAHPSPQAGYESAQRGDERCSQPGREAGAPPLCHQEPFVPQVKRESEFLARNFLKHRGAAGAGESSARILRKPKARGAGRGAAQGW